MIAIMDYGIGNLGSVKNALDKLEIESVITSNIDEILNADKVILPGVGAFNDAITTFKSKGFDKVVDQLIEKNTPILGICVGMQMLCNRSFEFGVHDGLKIIEGDVVKFNNEKNGIKYKIPQMGWNKIKVLDNNPLLKGLDGKYVYFVHSYHLDTINENSIALTDYAGITYCSAIHYKNIYATQFHPEKSGEVGLQILKNFGDL